LGVKLQCSTEEGKQLLVRVIGRFKLNESLRNWDSTVSSSLKQPPRKTQTNGESSKDLGGLLLSLAEIHKGWKCFGSPALFKAQRTKNKLRCPSYKDSWTYCCKHQTLPLWWCQWSWWARKHLLAYNSYMYPCHESESNFCHFFFLSSERFLVAISKSDSTLKVNQPQRIENSTCVFTVSIHSLLKVLVKILSFCL